jgi:hypothetical protein
MNSVVILAHATDSGAESVAASLAQRLGPQVVRIVRPETLSLASWSHRVDSTGRATTRVTLPGTEPIDDSRVAAVLNRIRYLPVPRFHRAPPKDRDYAGVEVQALVASWLASLGDRVVHVVREHPWLTPLLPLQHWAAPAADYGLPVAVRAVSSTLRSPRRSDPSTVAAAADAATVLVAGNRAGGPLSATFGPRCLRVARLLGFPLLEFGFIKEHGTTVLARVDPLPSLMEPWATAMTVDLLASRAGYRSG